MHTCLSPCAEDEMKPRAIAARAKELGLDFVGICDHNTTRNAAAACRAGEREGVAVLPGIEITSQEEVHVLGLFEGEESLPQVQRLMDQNRRGENNPDLLGEQWLCDEDDAIVGREARMLLGATLLTIEQVVESIHRLGGLAVASHVDRQSFSLLSQLGLVPEGLPLDALEISSRHTLAEARERFPQIEGFPLVRSSDAHRLAEIGSASITFRGASPTLAELRRALACEGGRKVVA